MPALGSARRVEQALLRDEHVRAARDAGPSRPRPRPRRSRRACRRGGRCRRGRTPPRATGTGPGERVVDLDDARRRSGTSRAPAGSAAGAGRRRARGTAAASRRAARVRAARRARRATSTVRPVSISPPSERRYDASASAIACEPPRGSGQPTAWPSIARTSPNDAVAGGLEREHRVRGVAGEERAGALAVEARARKPGRRAQRRAARTAPSSIGCRGGRGPASVSVDELVGAADERPEQALARPRRRSPRPAAVSASERSSTTAVPSSSGCASGAGGWIHSTPCSASGTERMNGEASRAGGSREQVSWRNPGSVSSSVRSPPPIVSRPSSTSTERPARASTIAAARPFGPEPTTIASCTLLTLPARLSRGLLARLEHVERRADRDRVPDVLRLRPLALLVDARRPCVVTSGASTPRWVARFASVCSQNLFSMPMAAHRRAPSR